MSIDVDTRDAFYNQYQTQERDILVVTKEYVGNGACKFYDAWMASAYFLAYVDLASGEVVDQDGRINWFVSEKDAQRAGCAYPYYFEGGTIYKLRIRKLKAELATSEVARFNNRFMLLEVLERNAPGEALAGLLADYQKPVVLEDKLLGPLVLNRDFGYFEGTVTWCGEETSLNLEVDTDDTDTWEETQAIARRLVAEQHARDSAWKNFAAAQLLENAMDWQDQASDQEQASTLSKEEFIQRISLSNLVVSYDGNSFSAYYDDGDLFFGHVIIVYGLPDGQLQSADIAG